ncbi:MAG: hypothetical protein ACE364_07880 [Chlorobiota bacterium]
MSIRIIVLLVIHFLIASCATISHRYVLELEEDSVKNWTKHSYDHGYYYFKLIDSSKLLEIRTPLFDEILSIGPFYMPLLMVPKFNFVENDWLKFTIFSNRYFTIPPETSLFINGHKVEYHIKYLHNPSRNYYRCEVNFKCDKDFLYKAELNLGSIKVNESNYKVPSLKLIINEYPIYKLLRWE